MNPDKETLPQKKGSKNDGRLHIINPDLPAEPYELSSEGYQSTEGNQKDSASCVEAHKNRSSLGILPSEQIAQEQEDYALTDLSQLHPSKNSSENRDFSKLSTSQKSPAKLTENEKRLRLEEFGKNFLQGSAGESLKTNHSFENSVAASAKNASQNYFSGNHDAWKQEISPVEKESNPTTSAAALKKESSRSLS